MCGSQTGFLCTSLLTLKCFDSEQGRTNPSEMFFVASRGQPNPDFVSLSLYRLMIHFLPPFLTLYSSVFLFVSPSHWIIWFFRRLGTSSRDFIRHSSDWLPLENPQVVFLFLSPYYSVLPSFHRFFSFSFSSWCLDYFYLFSYHCKSCFKCGSGR